MSEPTRYECKDGGKDYGMHKAIMEEYEHGYWVYYGDYLTLKARLALAEKVVEAAREIFGPFGISNYRQYEVMGKLVDAFEAFDLTKSEEGV